MTPVEALTQIRALCDEYDRYRPGFSMTKRVRAVLDAVSVDAAPAQDEPDEVLVEDSWFKRADLPEILSRYMRTVTEMGREIKALYLDATPPQGIAYRLEMAESAAVQYGEQLEAVGEELDRWKSEVRLVGKNRVHAERLEDILEGERS